MPGVVDGIAAAEGSRILGNDTAILMDHDTIGIGSAATGRLTALAVTEYQRGPSRRRRKHWTNIHYTSRLFGEETPLE